MDKVAAPPAPESVDMTATVIGINVVVRGDLEGPTDLHVKGRVLGKVRVTGLILDQEAEIDGPVTADAVVISGHINGPVEAKAVHVKSTGRIDGDITYSSLEVEAGGRLSGRLIISDELEFGNEKTADPTVRMAKPVADNKGSEQELIRMAARLRRVSE